MLFVVGVDAVLYAVRSDASPPIASISLSVALLLQAGSLFWIGWATGRRHYADPGRMPWIFLLVSVVWLVPALHYHGCARISLFGEGACALPKTGSVATRSTSTRTSSSCAANEPGHVDVGQTTPLSTRKE